MIRLKLTEPNFRCRVVDHHGRTFQWIGHAESKEELEARLLRKGFKSVENVKSFSLGRWQQRADAETVRVVEWCSENSDKKTGDYKWRDSVWKYLKVYLFAVSNGKCAFCETDALTVSPGDVEHFRPKARVEGEETHRGYYWLAYSLKNYLPSCGTCNTSGKANHFPVGGQRAACPEDDLNAEQPLLLNPLDPEDESPSRHLNFVIETDNRYKPEGRNLVGIVWSDSTRGERTIDILKLNRDALIVRRGQAIETFLQKLDQEYLKQLNLKGADIEQDCVVNLIKQELSSGSEYCAAKVAAASIWLKRWEERREAERKKIREVLKNEMFVE